MDQVFIQLRGRYKASEIARRLGISRQAVSSWFSAGRIPASRALAVAEMIDMPVDAVLKARRAPEQHERERAEAAQ